MLPFKIEDVADKTISLTNEVTMLMDLFQKDTESTNEEMAAAAVLMAGFYAKMGGAVLNSDPIDLIEGAIEAIDSGELATSMTSNTISIEND